MRLGRRVGSRSWGAALALGQVRGAAAAARPTDLISKGSVVVTKVQEATVETVVRMLSVVTTGLSMSDMMLIIAMMCIWEILKELLKALAVEQLRESCVCCSRRKQEPEARSRKQIYLISMDRMAHHYEDCKALQKAKAKAKPIEICKRCQDKKDMEELAERESTSGVE